MWRVAFFALCCIFGELTLSSGAFAERRVALVIGNAAYKNTPALANPKNDAADIAAALKGLGIEVFTGFDLDKPAMDRKFRDFATSLSGADVGLFFYAGHGLQVNGINYLIPIDAELSTAAALDFETVRLDLVQRFMEGETKTNILFLDACRDNPLARNLARALGTRAVGVGKGLAAQESGIGTLISYSTQPGNVALDGTGRNSPFAGALVKHLSAPGGDISDILINVRKDVMLATANKQVPWEHSALTGRFSFRAPELLETVPAMKPHLPSEPPDLIVPPILAKPLKGQFQTFNVTLGDQNGRGVIGVRVSIDSTNDIASSLVLPGKSGAWITEIVPNSPAAKAGFLVGDFLIKLDGASINSARDLVERITAKTPGTKIVVDIWRLENFNYLLRRLEEMASHGEARAALSLARIYETGLAGAKDESEALRWARKAAMAENIPAMLSLGITLQKTCPLWKRAVQQCSEQDAEAVRWMRKAAEAGDPYAMVNLGAMLDQGRGTTKDETEAARWVFAALERGDEYSVAFVTQALSTGPQWGVRTGAFTRFDGDIMWVGSTGFRKELQTRLQKEGLYSGPIDGSFSESMEQAVRQLASRSKKNG